MADSLQELIERLRQPLGREETLQAWDHWRRLMKQTRSSLPRDAFEAWCELQDEEERFPAAEALSSAHSEIERLRSALARCAEIVERNLYRQHEKVEDVKLIARTALEKPHG